MVGRAAETVEGVRGGVADYEVLGRVLEGGGEGL